MNIQSTDINFQGGFRFKNLPQEAKIKLPEISKRGKQIYENFETQNDVFLLIRDKYDKRVVDFIKEHNLNFEYTPLINTESKMDSEKPELLSQLIKDLKPKFVSTIDEVNEIIAKRIKPKKNKVKQIIEEEPYKKEISKILKSLCINDSLKIKQIKGISIIEDSEFSRKIYITKPSEKNIHYVIVEPFSKNKNTERYAMDSSGNILCRYKSPDGIKYFDTKFNSLTSR